MQVFIFILLAPIILPFILVGFLSNLIYTSFMAGWSDAYGEFMVWMDKYDWEVEAKK